LLLIPPIVGAAILIWWSVQRLAPVQGQVKEISDQLTRMNLEMDAMQERIRNAGGREAIEEQYQEAQDLLLPGRAGVEGWLRELNAAAIPLGLEVKVSFGMADNRRMSNHVVTVIPAAIAVETLPDSQDKSSPYHRLMELTKYLTKTRHRIDLVALRAQGLERSIKSAQLTVHLWSTELQTQTP
jgi:hypothetical protein